MAKLVKVSVRVLLLFLVIGLLLPVASGCADSSWWDANWQYRNVLSFNTYETHEDNRPFIPSETFEVIVLPDIQNYSSHYPHILNSQLQWIIDNASNENIKFVIGVGDLVNYWDRAEDWGNADVAMSILDGEVPYSVLPGNHDTQYGNDYSYFNTYFGPSRFEGYDWYQGHFPPDGNENNYCFFEAGGVELAVLSLGWRPSDSVLEWANSVIASNPDRKFIVATHEYLTAAGVRNDIGENIWQKIIKDNRNVFLVVCSHFRRVPFVSQSSTGSGGNRVFEVLGNYQDLPYGGNGWLVKYEFSIEGIKVTEYSPYIDEFGGSSFLGTVIPDLLDFPVMVTLSSNNFDFDKAKDYGEDIRFVDKDGVTVLEYRVNYWNKTDEQAIVWVNVPQIDANSDYSDYIYMYYGNPDASDAQDSERVFGDWYTISNCDSLRDWTGTDISFEDVYLKREGAYSVKDTVSTPEVDMNYVTTYNPSGTWDLSRDSLNIDFWLRSNGANTAYTSARLYLYDTADNYSYHNLKFSATTWTHFSKLAAGGTASAAPPDMTSIDRLTIEFVASDTTAFTKTIDWIESRWGSVAFWQLNEGSGTNIADSTRYAHDGTLEGAIWEQLPNGLWYPYYDGEGAYVDGGTSDALSITGDFTLALWLVSDVTLRPDGSEKYWSMGKGQIYSLRYDTTPLCGFMLCLHNDKTRVITTLADPLHRDMTAGKPYFLVGTRTGSLMTLYLNGIKIASRDNFEGNITNEPAAVFQLNRGDRIFNGITSLVSIYNQALSAFEIQTLYNQEKHLFGLSESDFIDYGSEEP